MKYFFLIFFCLYPLIGFGEKETGVYDGVYHISKESSRKSYKTYVTSADILKIATEMACDKNKIDDFNFSKEFAGLFDETYLKEDVTKIKEMSVKIDKEYRKACKEKGEFKFKVKSCYNACWKNYPPNNSLLSKHTPFIKKLKLLESQCIATCFSLNQRMLSYSSIMEDFFINQKGKNILCQKDSPRVNEKRRDIFRKIKDHEREAQEIIKQVEKK